MRVPTELAGAARAPRVQGNSIATPIAPWRASSTQQLQTPTPRTAASSPQPRYHAVTTPLPLVQMDLDDTAASYSPTASALAACTSTPTTSTDATRSNGHVPSMAPSVSNAAASTTTEQSQRQSISLHYHMQQSPHVPVDANTHGTSNKPSWTALLQQQWRARCKRLRCVACYAIALSVFALVFALVFVLPQSLQHRAPVVLGATLSVVATSSVVVSYVLLPQSRRYPNEQLVYITLCECGLAVLALVHVLVLCAPSAAVDDAASSSLQSQIPSLCQPMSLRVCSVLSALELFLLLASVGWFAAAIVHLFVSVSNPFVHYKRQLKLYHSVIWTSAIVLAVAVPLLVFSQQLQHKYDMSSVELCRAVDLLRSTLPAVGNVEDQHKRIHQWQQLLAIYYSALFLVVIVVVLAAQGLVIVGWWRSNSGTVIALDARRQMMHRMTIYVHALHATWLAVLVAFFVYRAHAHAVAPLQPVALMRFASSGVDRLTESNNSNSSRTEDEESVDVAAAVFHYVLAAKGAVTYIVWLCVNKQSCCCSRNRSKTPCSSHDDAVLDRESASAQLPHEQQLVDPDVERSSNPLAWSATSLMVLEGGASDFNALPPLPPPTATTTNRREPIDRAHLRQSSRIAALHRVALLRTSGGVLSASASSSVSSTDDNNASAASRVSWATQTSASLQREIIYYTVCGITKSIRKQTTDNADDDQAEEDEEDAIDTAPATPASVFVDYSLELSTVETRDVVPAQLQTDRAITRSSTLRPVHSDAYSSSSTATTTVRPATTSLSTTLHATNSSTCSSSNSSVQLSTRTSSLYPVSHVPFELFDHEIALASSNSSRTRTHRLRSSTLSSTASSAGRTPSLFTNLRRTAIGCVSPAPLPLHLPPPRLPAAAAAAAPSTLTQLLSVAPQQPFPQSTQSSPGVLDTVASSPAVAQKQKLFVDYAPRAFRCVRKSFGLSDASYVASFRATAKERVSAGASGAFMFFTGDNALLIKSMTERECRKLVAIAPAYAAYVAQHPQSRIIRFFGCHRLRLYGQNFYFVVMSNVLSTSESIAITEKYDLKGSWIDRKAKRPQLGDSVTCAACNARYVLGIEDRAGGRSTASFPSAATGDHHVHVPDTILKDLDLQRRLHLPQAVAVELYAQLVSDSAFLQSMGIMDYSLLVGIHTPPAAASATSSLPLGSSGTSKREMYFVGIIDILQEWDWEKQLERAGKVLLGKPSDGISAIPPAAYCARFQARVAQILLGDDSNNCDQVYGNAPPRGAGNSVAPAPATATMYAARPPMLRMATASLDNPRSESQSVGHTRSLQALLPVAASAPSLCMRSECDDDDAELAFMREAADVV